MRRTALLSILALASLAAAPATAGEAPADARSALRQADVDMCRAVGAHDRAAFAALVDTAAVFYGGGVLHGREAVTRGWDVFLDPASERTLWWEPYDVVVAASGDLGYTRGRYESRSLDPTGKSVVRHGRYVTVWCRGADGRWRARVDIGTAAADSLSPDPTDPGGR